MHSRSLGLTLVAFFGLIALAPQADARSFGIATQGGGCRSCHGPVSSEVAVTLTGPTVLAPGERGLYRIEMTEVIAGGLQVGTGINVALLNGAILSPVDPAVAQDPAFPLNMKILEGELTHVETVNTMSAPNGGIGVFFYEFPFIAPADEGMYLMKGVLNSFNQNFAATGDKWRRANSLAIMVVPEPSSTLCTAASLATLGALARFRRRRAV